MIGAEQDSRIRKTRKRKNDKKKVKMTERKRDIKQLNNKRKIQKEKDNTEE